MLDAGTALFRQPSFAKGLDIPAAIIQPAERRQHVSDVEADDADLAAHRTIACPALLLWSEYLTRGDAAAAEPPPAIWRRTLAPQLRDVLVRSGHFIPEEAPEATVKALLPFLLGPLPQARSARGISS